MVDKDTEEEAAIDEVAVVDEAVVADGINKKNSFNRTSILIRSFNKISNRNNIFQKPSIGTAGPPEHADIHQAFATLQLRDIVTMQLWKIG